MSAMSPSEMYALEKARRAGGANAVRLPRSSAVARATPKQAPLPVTAPTPNVQRFRRRLCSACEQWYQPKGPSDLACAECRATVPYTLLYAKARVETFSVKRSVAHSEYRHLNTRSA